MPKRDGFSLATALMEEDVQPRPVLFLTSAVYKHAKWKHEALTTYGAHEFLRKPVDADDLATAIGLYRQLADRQGLKGDKLRTLMTVASVQHQAGRDGDARATLPPISQ